MHTDRIRAVAHKACIAGVMIAGLQFSVVGPSALAQTPPPATPSASAAAAAGNAPSEAARRAALSPYRFILQSATAPPRAKPAAAPVEAKRPAATDQTASVRPSAAPAAVAPEQTPAAVPEPAAAVARSTQTPVPEPIAAVRREIVPIKTDEPHLSALLLREKPSGVVKVSFEIQPNGSTGAVKVVSSSNRALNRPSVDAVSGWKFEPVDEVLVVETELAYNFQ